MKTKDGNEYFITLIRTDEVIPGIIIRWDFPNEIAAQEFFSDYTEGFNFKESIAKYQIALLVNLKGKLYMRRAMYRKSMPKNMYKKTSA